MSVAAVQLASLDDIRKQVLAVRMAERYFDSVVLFALFDCGVLESLTDGPRSLGELHASIGGDEETLRATLDAAVALGLLSSNEGRYAASETILDTLAREDSPAYAGEWIALLHALLAPLARLGEAIRNGAPPGALFENMAGDKAPGVRMTAAMDAYARVRGVEIADRIDFAGTRSLLDLGCGPGTYSFAILQRYPQISATLLDLPGPIAEARRNAERYGLGERLAFVAADALSYEPSERFDTILLSNTLHMLGPRASRELLRRVRAMLAPGGRLIVQAQFLNDDRISPRWPALLSVIQRIATPEGRNHTVTETSEWLTGAGFSDVQHVRLSLWNVCSCLIALRPA